MSPPTLCADPCPIRDPILWDKSGNGIPILLKNPCRVLVILLSNSSRIVLKLAYDLHTKIKTAQVVSISSVSGGV